MKVNRAKEILSPEVSASLFFLPDEYTLRGTWHGQCARIVANAPNPDMIG